MKITTNNKPLATPPWVSYRAQGEYGYIMIGACNVDKRSEKRKVTRC